MTPSVPPQPQRLSPYHHHTKSVPNDKFDQQSEDEVESPQRRSSPGLYPSPLTPSLYPTPPQIYNAQYYSSQSPYDDLNLNPSPFQQPDWRLGQTPDLNPYLDYNQGQGQDQGLGYVSRGLDLKDVKHEDNPFFDEAESTSQSEEKKEPQNKKKGLLQKVLIGVGVACGVGALGGVMKGTAIILAGGAKQLGSGSRKTKKQQVPSSLYQSALG